MRFTYHNKICRNPNVPIAPYMVPRDLHTTTEHVQIWSMNMYLVYKMLTLNHRWLSVEFQHLQWIFALVLYRLLHSILLSFGRNELKLKSVNYDTFKGIITLYLLCLIRRLSEIFFFFLHHS